MRGRINFPDGYGEVVREKFPESNGPFSASDMFKADSRYSKADQSSWRDVMNRNGLLGDRLFVFIPGEADSFSLDSQGSRDHVDGSNGGETSFFEEEVLVFSGDVSGEGGSFNNNKVVGILFDAIVNPRRSSEIIHIVFPSLKTLS